MNIIVSSDLNSIYCFNILKNIVGSSNVNVTDFNYEHMNTVLVRVSGSTLISCHAGILQAS